MRLRKVNSWLILLDTILYRLIILVIDTIIVWVMVKEFQLAFGISLFYNGVKTGVYYGYRQLFTRIFKVGK